MTEVEEINCIIRYFVIEINHQQTTPFFQPFRKKFMALYCYIKGF